MIRKAFLITSISLSVAIMASCGGGSKQDKVSADTAMIYRLLPTTVMLYRIPRAA
jgi:hypothetical protein